MKDFFTRLGKAFHQIFIYLNLIDVNQNLSISNLTLYTSFTTTLILLWLGATSFVLGVASGLTLLCFTNYGYRRWMNMREDKSREEIDRLKVELTVKAGEWMLAEKELSVIKSRMNMGHSPEGSPFPTRRMPL